MHSYRGSCSLEPDVIFIRLGEQIERQRRRARRREFVRTHVETWDEYGQGYRTVDDPTMPSGKRLESVVCICGRTGLPVPNHYCSADGGPPL